MTFRFRNFSNFVDGIGIGFKKKWISSHTGASQPSATLPCTTISTEAKLTDKSVRQSPGIALQFQQTVEVRGKQKFHQLDMKCSGDHNKDDDAYTQ